MRHSPTATVIATKLAARRIGSFAGQSILEAEFANPIRLADVGRAVGASPAYLTHVFRRVEGTSPHQHLTRLRLARALVDLPRTDDLTALALETVSSHSHFTLLPARVRRHAVAVPGDVADATAAEIPE